MSEMIRTRKWTYYPRTVGDFIRWRARPRNTSKYMPHQGYKECARRRRATYLNDE